MKTLTRTLEMLRAAQRWPWNPDMKAARMERNVPKTLSVLPPHEAEDGRARIAAETARLDAAA